MHDTCLCLSMQERTYVERYFKTERDSQVLKFLFSFDYSKSSNFRGVLDFALTKSICLSNFPMKTLIILEN